MKTRTNGKWKVTAIAVAGLVALVSARFFSTEAVYPIERLRSFLSRHVVSRIAGVCSGAEAKAENVRLQREVAVLALVRSDNERLETENARLRRALEFTARNPEMWVPAEVLAEGGGASGVRSTIRAAKGVLDGIRRGATVVVPEGLVGRVHAVSPHTCEILLLSDERMKVACEIEIAGGGSAFGIATGGSDLMRLRYVTGPTEVPPRSRVVTSGLGGVFPKGLDIGTVLQVRSDPSGLAREGEIIPAVDCRSLEDVFIRREK